MAKRGADFQITKDNGPMPDFSFGGHASDPGGIQPQRATAQQMAKRKIATGKRSRMGSTGGGGGGGGGGPTVAPPSFNFGAAPETNGFTFGTTSTTFNSGGMSQPASTGGLGNSMFASSAGGGGGAGAGGGGFGSGTNSQTSSAPSANFNFSASSFNSNPFQGFGDKKPEASSTMTNGPSSLFASSHAPSAPANPFFNNSQPSTSSAEAPKFSFGTTSSSAPSSFTASAPAPSPSERATSPFGAPSNNTTTGFSFSATKPPQQSSPSPTFAANHTFTSEEIGRVQQFIKEIEPKYQSLGAFKTAVKTQLEQLQKDGKAAEILKSSTVDQQIENFATELQSLQKTLATTPAPSVVTFPQPLDKLLLALVDKEVGAPSKEPPKNPFQFQPTSQPPAASSTATTSPFQSTSSAPSASFSASSSPFNFPSSTPAQPASSPFTQSSAQAPAAAPSQPAQPTIDPSEFRSAIVKRATDNLAGSQVLQTTSDVVSHIRRTLNEVLSEKLPTMKPDNMPTTLTVNQLHSVIAKAVEEALTSVDKANAQNMRAMIRQSIDAAIPKIQTALQDAIIAAQKSETGSSPPNGVDPLPELERLRKECEQANPPNRVPEHLNTAQKKQMLAAFRIRLFGRHVDQLQQSLWLQPLAETKFHQEYNRIIADWEREAGLKRKSTSLEGIEPASKRQNVNGINASTPGQGSLFGTPAGNKRPVESDAPEASAKRAREDNASPLPPAGSSQTSQLFASITGSPTNTSLFSSQTDAQSKPQNNATNLFASAGSNSGSSPNIFGAAPKADNSASSAFAPKTSNYSSIFSSTGSQSQSSDKPATNPAPSFGFKPTGGAPSGTNFMAQFTKQASDTEAKAKEKRKLEDYDSEEETEEEWEKRDAAEQAAKRQKFREAATSAVGFVPKFGVSDSASEAGNVSETGKGNEADNEESDEHTGEEDEGEGEGSPGGDDAEEDEGEDEDAEGDDDDDQAPPASTTTPGRSIFDRIQKPDISPEADHTWKPDTPIKFGNATAQPSGGSVSEPETSKPNPFFSSANSSSNSNPFASNASGANPFASNMTGANPFAKASQSNSTAAEDTGSSSTSTAPPTFSFTSASPQKPGTTASGNLFANAAATSGDKPKSLFGFSSSGDNSSGSSTFVNPFANLAKPGSLPTFNNQPSSNSLAPTSIFATASSSRATSPGMTTGDESTGSTEEPPSNDPQLDLTSTRAGEENEDSLFEVRAKALELVKGGESGDAKGAEWVVRGVGQMRVLKNKETSKCRIILRAGPTAKVVLNAGLIPTTSYSHPTPKSVSFLASNGGVLSKWTLQVGKAEDAKELHELLEKHKAD